MCCLGEVSESLLPLLASRSYHILPNSTNTATQQHSNTATQQSGNTRNTATRQNLNLSGTIIFKFLKVYIDEYKLVAWSLKVMLPSVGALHEALAATTNVALGER